MAGIPVTPVHSLKIAYFLADTTEVEVPPLLETIDTSTAIVTLMVAKS